jgi:transposase InsO family protein
MVPMRNQTSEVIASKLVKHLILPYQVPTTIISDQGANLLSKIMSDVCILLNIDRLRSSSYHPQCNGITESVHKSAKVFIKFFTNSLQTNWPEILDYAVSAYNNTVHTSTNFTPYEVVYGHRKISAFNVIKNSNTIDLIENEHVQN